MPGVTFFPLEDVPFLSLFFNFYGYYLPIFLYATWTATALFDLHIGKYRSAPSKITWTLVLMFVPLVGPLIYHMFAARELDVVIRATMIFGGIAVMTIVFLYLGFALQTKVKFDPRITPIKSNLAASTYKSIVKRVKYSKGKKYTVACSFAPLYSNKKSKLSTQLLFGEECIAYEVSKDWSWVQSSRDQYVGYTPTVNLSKKLFKPTHKVTSLRTYIYKEPDIKSKYLFH